MLFNTLLLSGLAALAVASPIARRQDGASCTNNRPKPVLPVNGGQVELTAPANGTSLKYILLGFGFQNYTCASVNDAPTATGAVAMLYDVTALYPGQSPQSLTIDAFNGLAPKALYEKDIPLNVQLPPLLGVDPTAPFLVPDAPLELEGMDAPIPFAGHHFFNAGGVPTFKVSGPKGDVNFLAKKLESISAPTTADVGPDGTGAVGWLNLGANEGTTGAKFVYRVVTVGGNSHGCASGVTSDSTSYTTQYWIYE